MEFGYAKEAREFKSATLMFVILTIFEAIAVDALIGFLVKDLTLKIILIALAIITHALIIGWLFSPLWKKHRLTATHLHIRFSLGFKADIPLNTIIAAMPTHEKVTSLATLNALHVPAKDLVKAALSEHGQILLCFNGLYRFRIGKGVLADKLLINVDEPDKLLAQLNVPTELPESLLVP